MRQAAAFFAVCVTAAGCTAGQSTSPTVLPKTCGAYLRLPEAVRESLVMSTYRLVLATRRDLDGPRPTPFVMPGSLSTSVERREVAVWSAACRRLGGDVDFVSVVTTAVENPLMLPGVRDS
jgi:hypothetical protein